jgi:murein DD-endopeptidase MepM/ murein hydrolase activator NlpD
MIAQKQRTLLLWLVGFLLVFGLVTIYFLYPWLRTRVGRAGKLRQWLQNHAAHPNWAIQEGMICGAAPFMAPTRGYIGFIWGDSFQPGTRHQGVDIFGGEEPGKTPVLAAYQGYLTRLPDWKSTVIIRIPVDPLNPSRQIWTYYTHMADQNGSSYVSPQFPPGTRDVFVKAGTFLGYQGDYSGDPKNPVGVHLHFSVVLDDGQGGFRNELKIENTLDPSPYLGLTLDAAKNPNGVVICNYQVDQ